MLLSDSVCLGCLPRLISEAFVQIREARRGARCLPNGYSLSANFVGLALKKLASSVGFDALAPIELGEYVAEEINLN